MLATHLRVVRSRPSRVYMLGMGIFALGGLALALGGAGDVANSLGRDATFSGRTEIWGALLPTVTNPLIGTGFDSYWNSPNMLMFQSTMNSLGWYHAELYNSAHNGYLDLFLNLGWIGIGLLAVILTTGYQRACKAFARNREVAALLLACIVSGMIYSSTEAGFRTLCANWIFVLLGFAGASGILAGLVPNETAKSRASLRVGNRFAAVH